MKACQGTLLCNGCRLVQILYCVMVKACQDTLLCFESLLVNILYCVMDGGLPISFIV